ncbi:MAG: hypothetical protein AB7V26_13695 [Lysobacterales bacterium]
MSNIAPDLWRFYASLSRLEKDTNQGARLQRLSEIENLPTRGVYFFREVGETTSSGQPRVTRVGTHAVSVGSKSTLRGRLAAHRGTKSGSGNHRGSIFRLHVGMALRNRDGLELPHWGNGSTMPAALRTCPAALLAEAEHEQRVSKVIGNMSLLWVNVDDEPGPESLRSYIERNAIALLSNRCAPIEAGSGEWLGVHSVREKIRACRLWNLKYIDDGYDPAFLDELDRAIDRTCEPPMLHCGR